MVETRFKGKAWTFGDNIDTDQITPGKYLTLITPEELGKHVLEGARQEFPSLVGKGDIIVAARNFGCGSSREHAPVSIKGAGVSVVIAESYARIFYRNAFNVGLPILECPGIAEAVKEGDELSVDLSSGKITNLRSGETLQAAPLTEKAFELLEAGGLVPHVRKKLEARRAAKSA